MKKFFIGWGAGICVLLAGFNFFGWSLTPTSHVLKDVPKTVRDNPGTWRTHYTGGK
jgi:hypothetical protein